MNYKNVMLGGRIDGVSWKEAVEWREKAAARLDDAGISYFNPCDHIPSNYKGQIITIEQVESEGGLGGNEIFTRELFHLQNGCNIYLVNLLMPGIGTLIDLGMASALGITIIGFGALDPLKIHPSIRRTVHSMFDDLEDALDFIIQI